MSAEKSSHIEESRPVNTTQELTEAFQLGGILSRIETTLGHNTKVIERTDTAVHDMSNRMGAMEVTIGRQSEQITTLFQRIETIEAIPETQVSRYEFDELKSEVKGYRLSWPKIFTILAGIATIVVLVTYWDGITPAN